jgi:hypothetical protein
MARSRYSWQLPLYEPTHTYTNQTQRTHLHQPCSHSMLFLVLICCAYNAAASGLHARWACL